MYGAAAMFAALALIVAVAGLATESLIGMVLGAVLFGTLGKVVD